MTRIRSRVLLMACALAVFLVLIIVWRSRDAETEISDSDSSNAPPIGGALLVGSSDAQPESKTAKSETADATGNRETTANEFTVLVELDQEPVAGALVQVVRLGTSGEKRLSDSRTDASGVARITLDEQLGAGLFIEVAYATKTAYYRSVEAFAPDAAARQTIRLAPGGSIAFDVSTLPRDARPHVIEVSFFPPTHAHTSLVGENVPVRLGSVSLQSKVADHLMSIPVLRDGSSARISLPADFIVSPTIEPRGHGWVNISRIYSGPMRGMPGQTLLAIQEGRDHTLSTRWKELPSVEVEVRDIETRKPIANADVWLGARPENSSWRRYVHKHSTDVQGRAKIPLKLGAGLPKWSLEASQLVLVVAAPTHRSTVVTRPFRWGTSSVRVELTPRTGTTWMVEGKVSDEAGLPVRNLLLRISPSSLHGSHVEITTDSLGVFRRTFDESDAPLFFEWGSARIVPNTPWEEHDGRTMRIGFGEDVGAGGFRFPVDPTAMPYVNLVLTRREK